MDTYYVLFTCSEHNDIKINLMLTKLTKQFEHFQKNIAAQNMKFWVGKDHIETLHNKKEKNC